MAALLLLAIFAQFLTPLGAGVFAVAQDNLQISRDVLHLAEWGPPWDSKVAAAVSPYWIALLGSLIAIVWLWRQLPPSDRALFIVMTILSLYAARFIIFWAVALVPFWAQVVEPIIPTGMFAWARGDEERSVRASRVAFCLFACSGHRVRHSFSTLPADRRARDSAWRRSGPACSPPSRSEDL